MVFNTIVQRVMRMDWDHRALPAIVALTAWLCRKCRKKIASTFTEEIQSPHTIYVHTNAREVMLADDERRVHVNYICTYHCHKISGTLVRNGSLVPFSNDYGDPSPQQRVHTASIKMANKREQAEQAHGSAPKGSALVSMVGGSAIGNQH